MPRYRLDLEYDGRPYHGFQAQAGQPTLQGSIERAVTAFTGEAARIHAAGRTDSGVHALQQVAHVDLEREWRPEVVRDALNAHLVPEPIAILAASVAADDFHARFSARGKIYIYQLHRGAADPFLDPFCWSVPRSLAVETMRVTARCLTGRHDFRAFTALNGPAREDTVRELRRLDVTRRGRLVRIVAEADGFLYKMVRSLAGVLVAVGEGKLTPKDVRGILASRERTAAVQTAPPQGLFLVRVFYPR